MTWVKTLLYPGLPCLHRNKPEITLFKYKSSWSNTYHSRAVPGFQQHLIVQRFPLRITARGHSKVSEAWSQMVRETLFKFLFAPKWVFDLITKEIILSARTRIKDFVVTKRQLRTNSPEWRLGTEFFGSNQRRHFRGRGGEGREELSVRWLQKEFTQVSRAFFTKF